MEKLSMCRICLAADVRLSSVARNLQDMYEKLTAMTFKREGWRPLVACYICQARLRNCYQLRTDCLNSEELMTWMFNHRSNVLKPQILANINTFRAVAVLNLSIGQVIQNSTECHIKEEPTDYGDAELVQQYTKDSEDITFETDDLEDFDDDIIILGKNGRELDSSNRSLQSTDKLCPKIVKVVLERIDLNDSNISTFGLKKIHLNPQISKNTTFSSIKYEEAEAKVAKPKSIDINIDIVKPENKFMCKIKDETIDKIGATLHKHKVTTTHDKVHKQTTKSNICSKNGFRSKAHIECHTPTHADVKGFQCHICKKCNSSKSNLTKHMDTHSNVKRFHCNVCKKSFNQKAYLKRHRLTHTGVKSYVCDKCEKCFTVRPHLIRHLRIHTGEKPYSCNVCKKRFNEKSNLICHMRCHSDVQPYSCEICKRCFNLKGNLTRHYRTHAADKLYQCDACNQSFNRKTSIIFHMRLHNEKLFHCDKCNRIFRYEHSFKHHISTHNYEKSYECEVCKKIFKQYNKLKDHYRVHTGEKPYKCDVCKKCYSTKQSLRTHALKHTGEKPYLCDLCKIYVSSLSCLIRHFHRKHAGKKPFQCNVCKKCFLQKSTLERHMSTHNKKPFPCDVCKKCFSGIFQLECHMRIHTSKKP